MTKQTQLWAISVALFGVIISIIQLIYYVYPYQLETRTLTVDGQINWYTAEAVLALCWAGIFVPLGIVAYKIIGRSYNKQQK